MLRSLRRTTRSELPLFPLDPPKKTARPGSTRPGRARARESYAPCSVDAAPALGRLLAQLQTGPARAAALRTRDADLVGQRCAGRVDLPHDLGALAAVHAHQAIVLVRRVTDHRLLALGALHDLDGLLAEQDLQDHDLVLEHAARDLVHVAVDLDPDAGDPGALRSDALAVGVRALVARLHAALRRLGQLGRIRLLAGLVLSQQLLQRLGAGILGVLDAGLVQSRLQLLALLVGIAHRALSSCRPYCTPSIAIGPSRAAPARMSSGRSAISTTGAACGASSSVYQPSSSDSGTSPFGRPSWPSSSTQDSTAALSPRLPLASQPQPPATGLTSSLTGSVSASVIVTMLVISFLRVAPGRPRGSHQGLRQAIQRTALALRLLVVSRYFDVMAK